MRATSFSSIKSKDCSSPQGIHFGHFKGMLTGLCRELFGASSKRALSPVVFSVHRTERRSRYDLPEVPRGERRACNMCGGSGWIELGGAGMVHPNVLREVGYDPDRYSGWAFGFGVERLGLATLRSRRHSPIRQQRSGFSRTVELDVRVPISWLREYVALPNDTQAIADRLAMLGFPVAAIEKRPAIAGVVTGKIATRREASQRRPPAGRAGRRRREQLR